MGILDGFFSLGAKTNKVDGDEPQESGIVSDLTPELELDMKDEDLLGLTRQWQKKWDSSKFKSAWQKLAKENEEYWKGEQFMQPGEARPIIDNLIFEALETFLPQATRKNPEPNVTTDNTPEGQALADRVEKMLAFLADHLKLRLKLKKAARHWAIYHLGVIKVGWSLITDDITIKVIRPKNLVLDPESSVDEDGYTGKYVGEMRQEEASKLAARFPQKKKFIKEMVKAEMGTQIAYMEWWTPDYVCWILQDEVLGKAKNPHWNYDQESEVIDEFGLPVPQTIPGRNHLPSMEMPYVFLSIFNLGDQPADSTGLIQQNLANQDLINKRVRQIDQNADNMNGGLVVSGDSFTQEQAELASKALRKGGAIYVPSGDVNQAVKRDQVPPMPADLFNQLIDARRELRNIFGVSGSTPQGIQDEKTVRGKIITKGLDADRIGGGITEYLEQMADKIFNWMIQMMLVYYEERHSAAILGKHRSAEYIQLSAMDINRKILVSVKEGSLLPKDDVMEANQAVDLASKGLLDPITMFDKLQYPNPMETATTLYLWKVAPHMLFQNDPRVQQFLMAQAQMQQQQAQAQQQQGQQQQQQKMQQQQQAHQQKMQSQTAGHAQKLQQTAFKSNQDLLNKVSISK